MTSDITAAYPQLVVDAVYNPLESFTYDYDGNMTQDGRSSMMDGTGSIDLKSAMWNLKVEPFGILTAEQVSLAASNSFPFSSTINTRYSSIMSYTDTGFSMEDPIVQYMESEIQGTVPWLGNADFFNNLLPLPPPAE